MSSKRRRTWARVVESLHDHYRQWQDDSPENMMRLHKAVKEGRYLGSFVEWYFQKFFGPNSPQYVILMGLNRSKECF